MLIPQIIHATFEFGPWQFSYRVLALLILLVAFPVAFLLIRNEPGPSQQRQLASHGSEIRTDYGFTLREAMRTREFYVIGLAIMVFSVILTGLIPHVVPMMTELGASSSDAVLTASVMGMTIFFGRIGVGFLVDRFFAPYIAMAFFAMSAVGFFLLGAGTTGTQALIAAGMIGLVFGAESDLIGYLVGRYYGLKAFGEIYGFINGAFLVGASTGSLLLGATHDIFRQLHDIA